MSAKCLILQADPKRRHGDRVALFDGAILVAHGFTGLGKPPASSPEAGETPETRNAGGAYVNRYLRHVNSLKRDAPPLLRSRNLVQRASSFAGITRSSNGLLPRRPDVKSDARKDSKDINLLYGQSQKEQLRRSRTEISSAANLPSREAQELVQKAFQKQTAHKKQASTNGAQALANRFLSVDDANNEHFEMLYRRLSAHTLMEAAKVTFDDVPPSEDADEIFEEILADQTTSKIALKAPVAENISHTEATKPAVTDTSNEEVKSITASRQVEHIERPDDLSGAEALSNAMRIRSEGISQQETYPDKLLRPSIIKNISTPLALIQRAPTTVNWELLWARQKLKRPLEAPTFLWRFIRFCRADDIKHVVLQKLFDQCQRTELPAVASAICRAAAQGSLDPEVIASIQSFDDLNEMVKKHVDVYADAHVSVRPSSVQDSLRTSIFKSRARLSRETLGEILNSESRSSEQPLGTEGFCHLDAEAEVLGEAEAFERNSGHFIEMRLAWFDKELETLEDLIDDTMLLSEGVTATDILSGLIEGRSVEGKIVALKNYRFHTHVRDTLRYLTKRNEEDRSEIVGLLRRVDSYDWEKLDLKLVPLIGDALSEPLDEAFARTSVEASLW
eukprot:Blabericola_migrator_1__5838@NODE_2956_length_2171_cov_20_236217_g1345_i1_p1_GENE_NODE_2956_length_2171_cov_20_236217_g1345_i1NODE_2956_length_2171_cov_20_236217_g1345_i1_p1_ORF_typecomplete_len620_score103_98Peptidase_M16_C/PF05193_21/0_13DUF3024/PF11225_8/44DUF3024/PF11225_8/25_NODE_2956_length_2171_cov_20_236217_g1345_i12552114